MLIQETFSQTALPMVYFINMDGVVSTQLLERLGSPLMSIMMEETITTRKLIVGLR